MELIIDERYKVVSDKYNFVLQNLYDVKDKETQETIDQKWKDVGYFPQLSHALKRYAADMIKEQDKLNIDGLVDVLHKLERHIERVVRKENIVFIPKEGKE